MAPRLSRPGTPALLASAILLLFILLVPVPTSAQVNQVGSLAPAEVRGVDSIFSSLDNTRSPGCAVGVMEEGALVFARGYGMANLDHGIAITPQTVFRTGSVSKQFTAAVVVMLAREGRFSLDDDIREHFPEMPEYDAPITVRHLLHHTSGIRDYLELMGMRGVGDEATYGEDDVVELLARQEGLNFPPGSAYRYSNSGYLLLSRLVERVTGNTLRDEAERLLFGPLGMEVSHFHDNHREVVPRRATGYGFDPRWGFVVDQTTLDIVGDGGVFTSIAELASWMDNFRTLDVGGPELLETLETRGVLNDGTVLSYAMGLRHGVQGGVPFVGHGGSFVGYRAATLRYPDHGTAIMVLCNYSRVDPMALARGVGGVVLAEVMEAASPPEGVPSFEEPEVEAAPFTPQETAALEGEYYSRELDSTLRIFTGEEGLLVDVNGGWTLPILKRSDDSLTASYLALTVEREDGEVVGIRVGSGRAEGILFRRK